MRNSKTIDRFHVTLFKDSGRIQIEQTHRNGSRQVVGAIDLDNEDELIDLQHVLQWAHRRLFQGEGHEPVIEVPTPAPVYDGPKDFG